MSAGGGGPQRPADGADGRSRAPPDLALAQARQLALEASGLPAGWAGREQFVVCEIGAGLGLRFLVLWAAWRADPRRPRRLHVVAVDADPPLAGEPGAAAPPELAALAQQLAARWPPALPGLHRLRFDDGAVVLTLGWGDPHTLVPDLALGADAFLLDGGAPGPDRAPWPAPLLRAVGRLARPGATLAAGTADAALRQALADAGFAPAAGPATGRAITVARFAPRWPVQRHAAPAPWTASLDPPRPREAIVVGAGLGGCAAATALARRGWQVRVLDAAPAPACGASRLPGGLLHPEITPDDSRLARLTRAGYLLARAELAGLQQRLAHPLWWPCGVLQVDDRPVAARAALVRALGLPAGYAEAVAAADAERLAGRPLGRGGWWFPGGAIVAGAAWCRAALDAAGPALRVLPGLRVESLRPLAGETQAPAGWRVETQAGGFEAPLVVLACALDAARLLGQPRWLPMRPVRGRISRLPAAALAGLQAGVAGDGYAVPAWPGDPGAAAVGATYEMPSPDEPLPAWAGAGLARLQDATAVDGVATGWPAGPADDPEAHAANLVRWGRLFPGLPRPPVQGVFDGVRCVAGDRLPYAGPVPDAAAAAAAGPALRGGGLRDLPRLPGLYTVCALGSRGLVLAALAGELVAAQVEGEPWPLPRSLAEALDPGRRLLRGLRRA